MLRVASIASGGKVFHVLDRGDDRQKSFNDRGNSTPKLWSVWGRESGIEDAERLELLAQHGIV
ncbi:MAG TPA: hypothetical protein VNH11_02115 [Pirellulales bacterium]|nr:hypothetical protein [Pirellulales bacterium]